MTNRIDNLNNRSFYLMTHVIAGYPDLETSRDIILGMAEAGADLIEIQIPFSDPMADGPTIMQASQTALDHGTKVKDCFELIKEVRQKIGIPLLFMSYANIPFHYGLDNFIKDAKAAGIDGLIIPDIPFDESLNYIQTADKYNIYAIPVLSPDMSKTRLKMVCEMSKGFIYTTLKVGITGASETMSNEALKFIDLINSYSNLPVLAGFGISKKEQVDLLKEKSNGAIIGSHMINLYNEKGLSSVKDFIKKIKS